MTLHFLNDVANALNRHKTRSFFIIASLKSEPMGKLIKRIASVRLLISSLPARQAFSKPCLVNLISKDANRLFYLSVYP